MDSFKKSTLELIEDLADKKLSHRDAQRQYVMLAADYVDAGEHVRALDLLRKLDVDYVRGDLVQDATADETVLRALVLLVETFGADIAVYAGARKGSS